MGKKSGADDVVNGIKEKIESLIKEEENIKNVEQIRQFDRSVFPKFGELLRKMEGFVYARYGKKRNMRILMFLMSTAIQKMHLEMKNL